MCRWAQVGAEEGTLTPHLPQLRSQGVKSRVESRSQNTSRLLRDIQVNNPPKGQKWLLWGRGREERGQEAVVLYNMLCRAA